MTISDKNLSEIDSVNALFVHRDDKWGGLFEEVTLALYSGVLGLGDNAIDCGTNQGVHTNAMARACGHSGSVFAVEASPQMMERTKGNNMGFSTIEFVNRALWHTSGETMTFHYYPNESGLSGLRPNSGTSVAESYDVVSATLDEIATKPISLMKLDIEGAEYHALIGAERIMATDMPVIVFENGREESAKKFEYTKDDFFGLFERRGYALYTVAGMPLIRENWDAMMPWQFLALHPASPRTARAFSVTQNFVHRLRTNIA